MNAIRECDSLHNFQRWPGDFRGLSGGKLKPYEAPSVLLRLCSNRTSLGLYRPEHIDNMTMMMYAMSFI